MDINKSFNFKSDRLFKPKPQAHKSLKMNTCIYEK